MKLVSTGIKRQPVARFLRFRFDVLGAREMSKRTEGWGRRFDEPIKLPGGGRLVTQGCDRVARERDSAVRTPDERGSSRRALRHRGRREWRPDDVRPDGHDAGDQPSQACGIRPETQEPALGETQASEGPMTVLIYVNTSKQVGDADHLVVFANADAAETWFEENDPEGVAFEYEVLE
jgi:hypothetical protein